MAKSMLGFDIRMNIYIKYPSLDFILQQIQPKNLLVVQAIRG